MEAIAAWLRARGRTVTVLEALAEPTPRVPYRPVRSVDMLISRAAQLPWILHLAVRATAAWSPYERCWAFGLPGAEFDSFFALAAREDHPARIAILSLGGRDRVVPKVPPPPAGLFIARASAVEPAALRVFGRNHERRLVVRLDARPWRRLASLDALYPP